MSTEPNDGAEILNEVKRFLTRFIIFPDEHAANIVCAWIAHTHAVDSERKLVFDSTPRLVFLSKEPASGKSRALELTIRLSGRGQRVVDPTAPSITALINDERATLGLDEVDLLFGRGAGNKPIRAVLNAGYQRDMLIARRGQVIDPFSPVAMAGLGQNFASNPAISPLRTRSIVIWMQQRQAGEVIDEWRDRLYKGQVAHLRNVLTQWGRENAGVLAEAWPDMPPGVSDRNADVWTPLLAVADVAGGDWPTEIRAAASHVVSGEGTSNLAEELPSQRIVTDLNDIFGVTPQVSTAMLIEALYALPDGPWRTLWPDRATAPRELSLLLSRYGVGPTKIWLADEQRSVQGYKRADLAHLWPEDDQGSDLDSSALPGLPEKIAA